MECISRNRHSPSTLRARGKAPKTRDFSKNKRRTTHPMAFLEVPCNGASFSRGKKIDFFLDFSKKNRIPVPQGPLERPQIWSQNRQTGPSVKISLAESSQTNGIRQPPSIKCVPTRYRAARAVCTGSTLSAHLWLPRARACAGGVHQLQTKSCDQSFSA